MLCNAFSSFEGLLFLLVEDSRVRNPSDFGGFSVWGVSSRLQEISSSSSSSSSAEVEKRFKLFGFKDMGGECLFQDGDFLLSARKKPEMGSSCG